MSDLLEVELVPPAVAPVRRLPVLVKPGEGEALNSWLEAMAATLGRSRTHLCTFMLGYNPGTDRDWWRRPDDAALEKIAGWTGVDQRIVKSMTLAGCPIARSDEGADRLDSDAWTLPRPNRMYVPPFKICPVCLAADGRPFLRLSWLMGWSAVCIKHQCLLLDRCPSCRSPIFTFSAQRSNPPDPAFCRKCGIALCEHLGSAHPAVSELQMLLMGGKMSGAVTLPSIGSVDWGTLIAMLDVLLAFVWRVDRPTPRFHTLSKRQKLLFGRIGRDMNVAESENVAWYSNYGGLLILAWLFGALDERIKVMLAILMAERFDRHIAYFPDLPDPLRARLRALLPASVTPKLQPRPWQAWVKTLPETGDSLRARARLELIKHRRQRLWALAAILDGASAKAAARLAKVQPGTLYRWLGCGAVRVWRRCWSGGRTEPS